MPIIKKNGGGGGGGGGASFTVIQCDAGTSPTATGATDVLTETGSPQGIIVTTGDSATDTVTFSVANASITNTQIATGAAIAYSKLASLTSAHVLVGSAGGVATDVAMSGDISITNAGVTAIGAGKIVNAQINASAAIDFSKLATLTSANILVGNGSNVATSTAVTGDIAITNAGVTSIGAGKIVDAQVNASAAISLSKLAALTNHSRALASDSSGVITESAVTATELGYSSGVTSAIQTQINAKQATGNYITALTGDVTASGPGSVAASITAATVTGKLLTGYTSGAGTVAATDTILQGIQKLNGNIGSVNAIGNLGSTPSITLSSAPFVTGTLNANATFTLTGMVAGMTYQLYLTQDGTGNRTMSFSNVTWLNSTASAPAAGAASKVLMIVLACIDGTNFAGNFVGNY